RGASRGPGVAGAGRQAASHLPLPGFQGGDAVHRTDGGGRRGRRPPPRLRRALQSRRRDRLDTCDRRPLGERLHPDGQDRRAGALILGGEAATGFEPVHGGFADLSLNHLGTPPRELRSILASLARVNAQRACALPWRPRGRRGGGARGGLRFPLALLFLLLALLERLHATLGFSALTD